MKTLAALVQEVRDEVPACPSPRVTAALEAAAREFFERSGAWIEEIRVPIKAGSTRKDLSQRLTGDFLYIAEAGSEPVGVEFDLDGTLLSLTTSQFVDVTLTLKVAVSSTDKGTKIPDHVFDKARRGIVAGALMRLFGQKQPWGDLTLAAAKEADFRREVGRARGTAAGVAVKHEAIGRCLG